MTQFASGGNVSGSGAVTGAAGKAGISWDGPEGMLLSFLGALVILPVLGGGLMLLLMII